MEIEITIIIFVIGLLLEVIVSSFKNKIFSTIPVIISSIVFIITKEENWYILAFYQVIMCFIWLVMQNSIKIILKKKRNSEIEKTKIKDLM